VASFPQSTKTDPFYMFTCTKIKNKYGKRHDKKFKHHEKCPQKNSTLADTQNHWIKKISHSTHNKYTTSVNCDFQLLSQL
jgi:hypothetical protein